MLQSGDESVSVDGHGADTSHIAVRGYSSGHLCDCSAETEDRVIPALSGDGSSYTSLGV